MQKVIEACHGEFSTRGQAYLKELKTMTIGLSARIEFCRGQNTKMKVRAANEGISSEKRAESKRKLQPESNKDSNTVQSLQSELSRCKKALV